MHVKMCNILQQQVLLYCEKKKGVNKAKGIEPDTVVAIGKLTEGVESQKYNNDLPLHFLYANE